MILLLLKIAGDYFYSFAHVFTYHQFQAYSLHVPKESRFGHRHGLQKITLTTTFCYKIYIRI